MSTIEAGFGEKSRLKALLEHFSRIDDPRAPWRVAYPLPEILLLAVCGTIADCDDADGQWGQHRPGRVFDPHRDRQRIEVEAPRLDGASLMPEAVGEVKAMPGGDHPLLGDFAAAIEARCRTVVLNLAHVEADAEDAEGAGPSPYDGPSSAA